MKAVIQRVLSASVAVNGETISSIGKGLLVLVGIDRSESLALVQLSNSGTPVDDGPADSTTIIKKILSAKLFDDEDGNLWKKSVKEIDGEVLCVSQFTLLAQFKGAKPDFHESMSTIPGKAHYTSFMEEIRRTYDTTKIQEGRFGAMMAVSLTNDGPTTILLNSRETRSSLSSRAPSGTSTPQLTPVNPAEESQRKAEEIKAAKAAKKAEYEAQAAKKAEKRALAKRENDEKAAQRRAASGDGTEGRQRVSGQDLQPSADGVTTVVEGDESWVEKKLREMRLKSGDS